MIDCWTVGGAGVDADGDASAMMKRTMWSTAAACPPWRYSPLQQ